MGQALNYIRQLNQADGYMVRAGNEQAPVCWGGGLFFVILVSALVRKFRLETQDIGLGTPDSHSDIVNLLDTYVCVEINSLRCLTKIYFLHFYWD